MNYNIGSTIHVKVGPKFYYAYVLGYYNGYVSAVFIDSSKKYACVSNFSKEDIVEN